MTEAIRAFSDEAFDTFSLTRIFALPFAHNIASCRALEKAGFSLEAVLRRSCIKEGQITRSAAVRADPGAGGLSGRVPTPTARGRGSVSRWSRRRSVPTTASIHRWLIPKFSSGRRSGAPCGDRGSPCPTAFAETGVRRPVGEVVEQVAETNPANPGMVTAGAPTRYRRPPMISASGMLAPSGITSRSGSSGYMWWYP
jgi:hypothetical protein